MKKLISLLIICVMMVSLPVFVQAEAPAADTLSYTILRTPYDHDYEDATTDAIAKELKYTDMGVKYFDDGHGWAIRPCSTGSNEYSMIGGTSTEPAYVGVDGAAAIFHLEADYYITNAPASDLDLFSVKHSGYDVVNIGLTSDNEAYLRQRSGTGSADVTPWACTYTDETLNVPGWNHFEIWVDASDGNKIVSLKVNNSSNVHTVAHPWTTSLKQLLPYVKDANSDGIWIDNVKIDIMFKNYKTDVALIDTEGNPITDFSSDVDYNISKVKFSFSEKMNEETIVANNFKLINDLGIEIPFTGEYNAEDKTYTMTLSQTLRPKTGHTLTATGLKTAAGGYAHYTGDAPSDPASVIPTVTFTTKNSLFAITAVSGPTVSDGNANYSVTVQNNNAEPKGYIVAANKVTNTLNGVTFFKISDITVSEVTAANSYPVAVANDGNATGFFLLNGDGTFRMLDIWGE